ncbi:hypothetical protein [Desulfurispira natronophila]|uniref:DNA-binding NarL/FixJ family response regulator n=1 Tax=Desulfurispira natronophila TaxID=682562 RepID=A0A7W7Y2U6_9BACT|nr:hypothetical protein [Desulfurispira natronophila]MBB5020772.1 DNA-binding NarL/FixJ family response regulator [Desulfurispira natronophila]
MKHASTRKKINGAIFIIDGHDMSRNILARLLSMHICSVHTAPSIDQAIKHGRESSYHTILVDPSLVVRGGASDQNIQYLKEQFPSARVVLLLNFVDQQRQYPSSDMVFVKPLSLKPLLRAISASLRDESF